MKNLLILLFVAISTVAYSQTGKVRGTIIDETTGETLVGVTVVVKGTTQGASTDLDGKFSIDIAAGVYDVQVSYISYKTITIEGVEVKADDVTLMGTISLGQDVQDIGEVIVKAQVIKNTESALQTMKKKSSVMLDGISASKIQLIGDATAVEAAKRITGVSIEGGKYVYVRGLGDRYTKTTLNGMEIPGLDPDKNSIQMDIFPTNLISNMMISKNFTADLPADFTGGIMNVETKDFPDRKIFSLSLGVGYNPKMTFNSDFLTYEGGNTDWLGYDDGTRALPSGARSAIASETASYIGQSEYEDAIFDLTNSFNKTLGVDNKTSLMDHSMGISYANQFDIFKNSKHYADKAPKLGIILSGSYKRNYKYYDEYHTGDYQLESESSKNEMIYATMRDGSLGQEDVLIGLLGGVAYKTNLAKIKFNALHLQSGTKKAGLFYVDNNSEASNQSGYEAYVHNLEYNQRSLTNLLLAGTHVSKNSGWNLDWRVSPTFSVSDDPDIRKTTFPVNESNGVITYKFNAGEGGLPTRIWRSLEETSLSSKLDITKKYNFLGADAKLKFGGAYNYKERDYEIISYILQSASTQKSWDTMDANQILDPDNLYPSGRKFYYVADYDDPNSNAYSANVNSVAGYISDEFNIMSQFKATVGVRVEKYVLRHTGRDQSNEYVLDNDIVLDDFDFFPSLNLIYSLTEDQNLRVAYSSTIARPSFKELSYAQIYDPLTDKTFNGGLLVDTDSETGEVVWDGNLTSTHINNIDVRWELFGTLAQTVSLSAFYKGFKDPIELVRSSTVGTGNNYQPRNVGNGTVYGVEFEFKKNLDFLSLANFNVNGNFTFVDSKIEMTSDEYESRKRFVRDGQTIDKDRAMAGQAPYVINAGLVYGNQDLGFDAGLFYNVKGKTLYVVGTGFVPDSYIMPFHSLNFSLNKKLGKENRSSVELKASNILGSEYKESYQSYNSSDYYGKHFSAGVSFSLGYKFKF